MARDDEGESIMSDVMTIKDYLVGLGFNIDQSGFSKFNRTLADLTAAVQRNQSTIAATYVKAGTAIVGVLSSITVATVALMDKISQTDLEYKKFALHMFMSTDAAKKLKISVDALGESLEDIAWMPELRERYFDLIRLQDELQGQFPEGDYEGQMKYIRDIRFELTRMKVEGVYALQWIGYHLFKNLVGPIGDIREGLQKVNDWIIENMPNWTSKVADVLTKVVDVFKSLIRFGTDFKEVLIGIGAALAIGTPFGRALALVTAVTLAIEDFYGYLDGKDSSHTLAPIWDILVKTLDIISKSARTAVVAVSALGELGWKGFIHGNKGLADRVNKDIRGIWEERGPWEQRKESGGINKPLLGLVSPRSSNRQHEAAQAAQAVSSKTGIPAAFIYGQWAHETGNFTNRGATDLNNLAGIKNQSLSGYRSFGSINEFADYYANLLTNKRYSSAGVPSAKTPEEFAQALKRGGYYEDSVSNYTAGLNRGIANYNLSVGGITVNVTQPNATADDIATRTAKKVQETMEIANARMQREMSGVTY